MEENHNAGFTSLQWVGLVFGALLSGLLLMAFCAIVLLF
jgi:hypothetical protein